MALPRHMIEYCCYAAAADLLPRLRPRLVGVLPQLPQLTCLPRWCPPSLTPTPQSLQQSIDIVGDNYLLNTFVRLRQFSLAFEGAQKVSLKKYFTQGQWTHM